MIDIKDFIHLHLHTHYSLLDGANKISDVIAKAKELGMDSIAITDHNHIGGWYEFKETCDENGIKPILGCELYQTWDTNILNKDADERKKMAIEKAKLAGIEIPKVVKTKTKKNNGITAKELNELIKPYMYDTKQYHIIVLAMNQTGMNNLIKLQSEASRICTYNGRFCCDFDLLEKYNEGLIVTSACLGGIIPSMIEKGNIDLAYELAEKFKDIFDDRFYLEIQPLALEQQKIVNLEIAKMGEKLNIPLVATTDSHYTNKEDWDDHDTFLCVGLGKFKSDENRMKYLNEYWIKSKEEMVEEFAQNHTDLDDKYIEEALNNTRVIADRIEEVTLGSKKPLFPKVYIPKGLTAEEYLTAKTYQNLYKYKNTHPNIDTAEYEARLYEELDIINAKGFAPYMLKIIENVEYCEENDIPLGPGRGSAAGSLALFVNGGTKLTDPLKYDLLFFRFLTKDRKDPPDIDMDYSYLNRDKFIKHLEEEHGKNAVCHIGTYTMLGIKNGIKDFGRVLEMPFADLNKITKKIDEIIDIPGARFKDIDKFKIDAEDAKKENDTATYNKLMDKYNSFMALEKEYPELFRLVRKFEGTIRNMGCHASGVLVMPCDVIDYFPVRYDKEKGVVALFTGPQLESLGAIKLDILGLKTLDVFDKTIKAINPKMTVNDLYNIVEKHYTDKKMFKLLNNKETEGLFQVESDLFKSIIDKMKPSDENDICAALAIGRPGPLSAKMDERYGLRKEGLEDPTVQLRDTEDITGNTYNTIIYQEQIMLIAKKVAKFNDSQSDSLCRKPLSKKKKKLMKIFRRCFIYGKLNCEPPEGFEDNEDADAPYYDPKAKYGEEILGGINNGYSEEELKEFYEKLKGYASYLFNKSHSASYSVITLCTMFLKTYYPAEFYAALFTMDEDMKKTDLYRKSLSRYNLELQLPDINDSVYDFKAEENVIHYGLKAIKGVGDNAINSIINNRPYTGIKDSIDKNPKKFLNKSALKSLISAGAYDFENENRYALLNEMFDYRKDKDDRYVESTYDKGECIKLEKKYLGTSIKYTPKWDTLPIDKPVIETFNLKNVTVKKDKKGKNMGFVKLELEGVEIDALAFASLYCKNTQAFDLKRTAKLTLSGKKDSKGKFIINSVVKREPLIIKDEDYNFDFTQFA